MQRNCTAIRVLALATGLLAAAGALAKDIKVAFGTDVDAVGGWLGSYGGEDSPDDISRGIFAGEVLGGAGAG